VGANIFNSIENAQLLISSVCKQPARNSSGESGHINSEFASNSTNLQIPKAKQFKPVSRPGNIASLAMEMTCL
jgi:hypothetical protein